MNFHETLSQYIQATINVVQAFANLFNEFLKCYPNKKVVHLALHSKNERVCKKNTNRLKKDFLEWWRKQC